MILFCASYAGFISNDIIFVNKFGRALADQYDIRISQINDQTILFNMTSSLQQYNDVLREVMYDNTAEEPGDGTRVVVTTITDEAGNLVSAYTTINITSTNDPATIFQGERTLTFNERTRIPLSLFNSTDTISDPDDSMLTWIYIAITNESVGRFGYDTLMADYGATNLQITNETRTSLNISGMASFKDYESVLQTVTFSNIYPGIEGHTRTVIIQTFDGQGPPGNQTIRINIAPFNDPPICYFGELVRLGTRGIKRQSLCVKIFRITVMVLCLYLFVFFLFMHMKCYLYYLECASSSSDLHRGG